MLRIDPAIRALFTAASCSRRSPDHCVKDALIVIPNSRKHELAIEDGALLVQASVAESARGRGSSGRSRDGPNIATAAEVQVDPVAVMQHPAEPLEVDKPIRCPPPEPSIIQDSRARGERRALSTVKSWQLRFLSESELVESQRDHPGSS